MFISTEANAWMDTEVDMKWTKHTLKNGLENDPGEEVLLAGNVGFQQAQEYHAACRELNTIVYLLPNKKQIKCNQLLQDLRE